MAEILKGKRRDGKEWRALSDAGSAAGVVIPVEGACFVDAGLIGLGSGGRIEIKLDFGGGMVLHLVRG